MCPERSDRRITSAGGPGAAIAGASLRRVVGAGRAGWVKRVAARKGGVQGAGGGGLVGWDPIAAVLCNRHG